MTLGEDRLRQVLTWLVIALLLVPVGGALWLGVALGESPCILCWAQRTSMILISLVALFMVRYGPRPRYLGVLILLGAWGIWMATRHASLHVARDIGQGFAANILGAHTYTWAWVIHFVVLIVAGKLLFFYRGPLGENDGDGPAPRDVTGVGRFAMGLFVVLTAANAVQAFVSTGPPPFLGQGDPVRMSLNPAYWVWSTGELSGSVGWRGSWAVPRPDPATPTVNPDPAAGPLSGLPALTVEQRHRVTAELEGRITGFEIIGPAPAAPGSDTGGTAAAGALPARVLVTTDGYAVYVLHAGMSGIHHRVVLDPAFSIDLTPLVGTAVLGDTLAVLSLNKSYVLLQSHPDADPVREWRHFLESTGDVTELRRSRFATLRARLQYVSSLAYDPAADELITLSVPSDLHPQLVVSRFDRDDFVLSSEFIPEPGPGLPQPAAGRSMGEYHVTGTTVVDGRLYAISAAFSTLLVIDLESERIVDAYAVPGLDAPVGLASLDESLWIAQADGQVVVVRRPSGHE